jgi:hypothetical protein
MIKWLTRPYLLLALSGALVAGGAFLVFQARPAPMRPLPLPVAAGEQEIAWLYPATSASTWERFVASVRRAAERWESRYPGLEAQVTEATFPRQTTTTPEVRLALPGGPRLVFRWYKLTSTWKTHDWVDALMHRSPPPLAVLGGNSSDGARELAVKLAQLCEPLPEEDRPLLLLTTATADQVLPPAGPESGDPDAAAPSWPHNEGVPGARLHQLYPHRTFRFCFTNRQMAAAITNFIWSQDDLRPDSDPVYLAQWNDDSYSVDLIDGFLRTLRAQMARQTVGDWGWVSGCVANGLPMGLVGGSFPLLLGGGFRFELPSVQRIDSSVGAFASPNRYEAKVAGELLDTLQAQQTAQKRPLLVLAGQTQPSRRFLRALVRASPEQARRFVVATGDGISFNTVYRDRAAAWPIQDLPCPLVFFCHHDPVDSEAGFRPASSRAEDEEGSSATSGTEDVLLYADIVEALIQTHLDTPSPPATAEELGQRLLRLRLHEGRLGLGEQGVALFNKEGQRHSGTGEHIVCLRPNVQGQRVLPEASIEVWAWRRQETGKKEWEMRGEPLTAHYDEIPAEGGADGGNP